MLKCYLPILCVFASNGPQLEVSAWGSLICFDCTRRVRSICELPTIPSSVANGQWPVVQGMRAQKAQFSLLSQDKPWGALDTPEHWARLGWGRDFAWYTLMLHSPFLSCFPQSLTSVSWEYFINKCYGLNCVPQNSYVEVLLLVPQKWLYLEIGSLKE